MVWSVALYGAETWTLRKNEKRRPDALEMWILRRIKKIAWTDRKTNVEVLEMLGEKQVIVKTIVRRKKNWIGHVMRGEGLLREVMEGRVEGKRSRGRKRMRMLVELYEKQLYGIMKRRAVDRILWTCWKP